MGNLAELVETATAGILERLAAGGVPAALTEADLSGPGVLLMAPAIRLRFGGPSCAGLDWTAYALGSAAIGRKAALAQVVVVLEAAGAALRWPFASCAAVEFSSTKGAVLPAYMFTWST